MHIVAAASRTSVVVVQIDLDLRHLTALQGQVFRILINLRRVRGAVLLVGESFVRFPGRLVLQAFFAISHDALEGVDQGAAVGFARDLVDGVVKLESGRAAMAVVQGISTLAHLRSHITLVVLT